MRLRLIVIVAVLALVFVVAAVCNRQPMTEFTSAEYKFKAKYPSTPKETEESREGIKAKVFSTSTKNGAYKVSVVELVPLNLSPEALSQRLEGARDAEVGGMNGKLISSTPIKLADKYPGLDFTVERPGKGTYRVRMYIVGPRYYHVSAMGAENYATTPEATAFLDSFQLLE
jgi:hypothetical protein